MTTLNSSNFQRAHDRKQDQLRKVQITRGYTVHAEGSVLIEFGDTRVLCTASVEEKVPGHKKGSGEGWVTAEYGMLPRATHTRGWKTMNHLRPISCRTSMTSMRLSARDWECHR